MSQGYEGLEQSNENEQSNGAANWRRQQEQAVADANARATAAEAAAEAGRAAQRELAMLKVGIDVKTPNGRMFVDAYKGEPTEEAVREAAVGYGLVQPPVSSDEQQTHQRIADATSGGGTPSSQPTADLMQQMRAAADPMTGSKEQLLEVLKLHGAVISNEQPGDWIFPPGTPVEAMIRQ